MSDDPARIVADLQEDLFEAYSRAGIASYWALGKRLKEVEPDVRRPDGHTVSMSQTTAYTILRGERQRPLTWDQIEILVRAFHAECRSRGIDPAVVGSLAMWKSRHAAVIHAWHAARKPVLSPAARIPVLQVAEPHEAGGGGSWFGKFADIVPPWLEHYLRYEPFASRISCYGQHHVPDLLQRGSYVTELMRNRFPDEPDTQITRRVDLHMLRQKYVLPVKARTILTVINEGALRDNRITRPVMREQIQHLLGLDKHIRVQVLPASHRYHHSVPGPITILRFEWNDLPSITLLEGDNDALYPLTEEEQAFYQHQFEVISRAAPLPDVSHDLLRAIESDL